jgi:hypothetical protein
MSGFDCRKIGETASGLLEPGVRGRVIAGFSGAAYLLTEKSELFWLAPQSAPMHARGLQMEGPFPKMIAGERFFSQDKCINISPDIRAGFGGAGIWKTAPAADHAAPGIERVAERVESLFSMGFDLSQARGFGLLIPDILSTAAGHGERTEGETDPVLSTARAIIRRIARACLARDFSRLLQESGALIGLGRGLTPSGDDFLGGLLYCIHAMQKLYPGSIGMNPIALASFIGSAGLRTNLISFTLLRDLAHGSAAEPFRELTCAVFSEEPPEKTRELAYRSTRIGHSTGWDLLAGLLTGLLAAFRHAGSKSAAAVSHEPTIDHRRKSFEHQTKN